MDDFKKLIKHYLLRTLLCIPIMLYIFAISIMIYDSGIPDNYLYHCTIVFELLWLILLPLFIVISKTRKSFKLKGIEISYKLNYLTGGLVAFLIGFIVSFIHLSPSNFIELIMAIITTVLAISSFCLCNYIYSKVSVVEKTIKFIIISFIVYYVGYCMFLSIFY